MTDQNYQTEGSRSPTYPYLTLEAAVNLAKIFFDNYHTSKIPIGIALEKMNYKITSGSGARVIAALTQFHLFDTEGSRDNRKIWLSELGLAIVRENPRDPDSRLRAIRQAALQPNLFKWAYDHYRLGTEPFPAPEVFRYDLETEMGFPERTGTADAFIRKFQATYDYAQLGFSGNSHEESPKDQEVHKPSKSLDRTNNVFAAPISDTPIPESVRPLEPEGKEYSTSLTRGKTARLIIPSVMKRKDFELLASWLDLLREAALYVDEEDNASDTEDRGGA